MRIRILLLSALLVACGCKGRTPAEQTDAKPLAALIYCTDEDRLVFDRYIQAMSSKKNLPLGDLIVETARFFSDVPYVASTLEREPEGLVINLREMDCTTFVENGIALAYTMKDPHPSFDTFCLYLQRLRYRDETIRDYTDRLHYFSDWIVENGRKGFVADATQQIGGEPYRVNLSFMSTHPDSYRQLTSNPEWIRSMREKEQEISARETYATIPAKQIAECEKGMKSGDIVCFVTNIKGLDISHAGFICVKGNNVRFIHASSSAKKVVESTSSLTSYVNGVKTITGVMIIRPQKP
ncbi:MAG: DUF1460 domain-containing protein [Tannerella sp.]|jgi:hypothetical protein|nr:DUF1460 domain-containing protein [Tannerella sp.]